jgi:hypothetical protein
MHEIVHYIYWECPKACWGTRKVYSNWIKSGGLAGLETSGDEAKTS